jgi:hypothetical protein
VSVPTKEEILARDAIRDFLASCGPGTDNFVGGVERLMLENALEKLDAKVQPVEILLSKEGGSH